MPRKSALARRSTLIACLTLLLAIGSSTARAQETSGLEAAVALETTLIQSIAKSEKSVVAIGIFRKNARLKPGGFNPSNLSQRPAISTVPDHYGTGVVIGPRLILTNHHVVLRESPSSKSPDSKTPSPSRKFIRVAGHPNWIPATIKAADPHSDLAVLEIDEASSKTLQLTPIVFGDAKQLKKGQILLALGNPYAIANDGSVSASWGIVANLRRRVPPDFESKEPLKLQNFGTLIQTDAKLNLGTSGGAVLNLKGEMVGLTTSLAALAGYEKSAGFAIAVDDMFRRIVEKLKEGKEVEYGLLGVSFDPPRPTDGPRSPGVQVREIIFGAPAQYSLKRYDVVTHIDDMQINERSDLMLAISRHAPGDQTKVDFTRLGAPMTRFVQLAKNKVRGKQVITTPAPSWRGLRVEYPFPRERLNPLGPYLLESASVVVTSVEPDSPSARAGIVPRMRITHVAKAPVAGKSTTPLATPERFLQLASAETGDVLLGITAADGKPTTLTVGPTSP